MRPSAPVVDASVFAEYLVPGDAADAVAPLFARDRGWCWIPDHCLVQVASVARRHHLRTGRGNLRDVTRTLEDLLALELRIMGSEELIVPAARHMATVTSYHAVYLALAEACDAPLCTFDGGQAAAARRIGIEVLVPGTRAFAAWIGRSGG